MTRKERNACEVFDVLHNQFKRNHIGTAPSKDEGGCLDDLPVDHREEVRKEREKQRVSHSLFFV